MATLHEYCSELERKCAGEGGVPQFTCVVLPDNTISIFGVENLDPSAVRKVLGEAYKTVCREELRLKHAYKNAIMLDPSKLKPLK